MVRLGMELVEVEDQRLVHFDKEMVVAYFDSVELDAHVLPKNQLAYLVVVLGIGKEHVVIELLEVVEEQQHHEVVEVG